MKSRTKKYYDQEAQNYKNMYEKNYKKYPMNLIRLQIITERLKQNKINSILDVGCGSCTPMIKLLKKGFDVKGCDYSKNMIRIGKEELRAEGFDPKLIVHADLEKDKNLPNGKFDAILALGVFPHLRNELKSLQILKKRLKSNGKIFIEFRNELFDLFSVNSYSVDFFLNKMIKLDSLPLKIRKDVIKFYSNLFKVDKPKKQKSGKLSYYDIDARGRNPLTIKSKLFEIAGFTVDKIHFYHFHVLPPIYEQRFPKEFRQLSLKLEKKDDWRGYFLSSAFVVEATKNH